MARILVVEDDLKENKLVCAVLKRAGYEPVSARDGQEALDLLDCERFDLIVSDVMMPRIDGFELVRMLREARYELPILMLTAKQMQQDKREGFILGADDYLTKPFDMQELVLRIRALLRRSGAMDARKLEASGAVLDANALTVSREGEVVTLPPKEFQLLFRLLSAPGRAFSRAQLLEEVWGWDSESAESTVSVHINRLRTRFADWNEFEITTVRGVGYRATLAEKEKRDGE